MGARSTKWRDSDEIEIIVVERMRLKEASTGERNLWLDRRKQSLYKSCNQLGCSCIYVRTCEINELMNLYQLELQFFPVFQEERSR